LYKRRFLQDFVHFSVVIFLNVCCFDTD